MEVLFCMGLAVFGFWLLSKISGQSTENEEARLKEDARRRREVDEEHSQRFVPGQRANGHLLVNAQISIVSLRLHRRQLRSREDRRWAQK